LPQKVFQQGQGDVVALIGGVPLPGDDRAVIGDQATDFYADNPTMIALPLLAHLLGTAPFRTYWPRSAGRALGRQENPKH